MPKAAGYCYAVKKGRKTGVFDTWPECEAQTKGYPGSKYHKFPTRDKAEEYLRSPNEVFASTTRALVEHARLIAQPSPTNQLAVASTSARAPLPVPTQIDSDSDIVYSDGSCRGNGQKGSYAGVGVWWGSDDPRNLAERCPGDQTNNRAELIAIIRILETTPHSSRPLVIKSDSRYSIDCVQKWLPGWKRKGWRTAGGTPVKNVQLIKYLAALLDERHQKSGSKVVLQHVYGHQGEQGNEGADALANLGATLPEVPEPDWDALRRAVETAMRKKAVEEAVSAPFGATATTTQLVVQETKPPSTGFVEPADVDEFEFGLELLAGDDELLNEIEQG
ncbi:ribonuclease H-like protein [Auriscalpium vulgare]|uniref:Ribonuclease H-like protein n=1 Tax=Auriscalpium vulgare TaxID=40419 RepID=A0ACB8R6R6_9AGAM|nr:ribonuclease H-like protein [Auriscalpium vulgare]